MIAIEADARALGISIATSTVSNVKVRDSPYELRVEVEKSRELSQNLTADPIIRVYRDFYWRIGLDPTKVRPSGEALRRRIINGKPFPFINNVVDCGNLISLKTLVPIGLYDLAKIVGKPRITLTKGEEKFLPIGEKEEITLRPGLPVMIDDEKVLHLYPHRDSIFSSISSSTEKVLVVAAGVPGIGREVLERACRSVVNCLETYCGGLSSEVQII